jgi:hypothetical protein
MDRTEYEKAYPNYCKPCKGWGMFKTLNPNILFWDCECVKVARCPRCGEEKALDNMRKCSKCGWNQYDKGRGLPGSHVI